MSYLLSRLCFLLGLLLLLFPPQLMSTCNLIPLLDIPGFLCIGNLLCIYWSPYVSQRHPFLLSQCMQNDWNSATTARNFSWHFMVSTHHISASMLWMIVWAFHECVWKNEKVSRQCHTTKYNYCRQLIHPFSSVYQFRAVWGMEHILAASGGEAGYTMKIKRTHTWRTRHTKNRFRRQIQTQDLLL